MIYGGTQRHVPSFPKDAHRWDKESMPKRADSISFLRSMLWMNRNTQLISRRNFLLASQASITSLARRFPIQPRKFRLAETSPSHLYGGVGFGNTSDQSSCMTVSPIHSRACSALQKEHKLADCLWLALVGARLSNTAPQRGNYDVHPTPGRAPGLSWWALCVRVSRHFSWLEAGCVKVASSRLTHQYPAELPSIWTACGA
jgi:hypothetical protein